MIRRYHVYKGKEEDGEESITVKDLVIQKSFNEVMKQPGNSSYGFGIPHPFTAGVQPGKIVYH